MILTIILILIIAAGLLFNYFADYGFSLYGFLMVNIGSVMLIIHIICCSISSYNYDLFVTKRDAFELTLNNSRENGNELEAATIIRDVSKWNQKLASLKHNNSTLFFDPYIDDRINDLTPIK